MIAEAVDSDDVDSLREELLHKDATCRALAAALHAAELEAAWNFKRWQTVVGHHAKERERRMALEIEINSRATEPS